MLKSKEAYKNRSTTAEKRSQIPVGMPSPLSHTRHFNLSKVKVEELRRMASNGNGRLLSCVICTHRN